MWKEPLTLVINELKILWKPYIATLLFTIMLGIFSSTMLSHLAEFLAEGEGSYNSVSLDIIFGMLTPWFTTIFLSSPYLSFKTVKEDPFGKRMALYRTMPISMKLLARSRMLLMLATFITLSLAFYLAMMISLPASFYHIVPSELFTAFILFWFGYSLAIGSLNVFIEYGTNGKVLYIFSFLCGFIIAILIILFNILGDAGVVETVIIMLQQSRWPVVIMLLLGIISYTTWENLLRSRLNKRDYL
ncbi:hypothetical protein [Gracilibacillus xinjiangensis]|uniref:ABC-2 family transporter protein n=1 Tax=Gracilibacillus xinjiangensis TaxID=1193282 RepID=A0ABV8WYJ5_9BACI